MTKLDYDLDTETRTSHKLTVRDRDKTGANIRLKDIVDGYIAAREAGYHVDDAKVFFRSSGMVLVWED